MKSTAMESGPSKLNFSPARLKIQNCFCTFKHQGCPHLWTSVGLPLLLHMTNQGPQPYHGCLVLLPHTARTFLQGTALSHRRSPVSSPFKESFSEPSGASLGSRCYWVDPGHQTLIFTATVHSLFDLQLLYSRAWGSATWARRRQSHTSRQHKTY